MAERLATELLERLQQSERANFDLRIQLVATRAELKTAKDVAVLPNNHWVMRVMNAMANEYDKEKDKVAELQNEVAGLEKTIKDVRTALDLLAAKSEPATIVKEEPEKDFTSYDRSQYYTDDPNPPRQSVLQPPPPVIMPPMAAGYPRSAYVPRHPRISEQSAAAVAEGLWE
ncbi:hypothetical protein LTS10_000127 [Elasticomyces elasticus]|nr:hypothetical protein LTS10_000127 [Elasticomyces elasticus]